MIRWKKYKNYHLEIDEGSEVTDVTIYDGTAKLAHIAFEKGTDDDTIISDIADLMEKIPLYSKKSRNS